jgi:hypothetical protein
VLGKVSIGKIPDSIFKPCTFELTENSQNYDIQNDLMEKIKMSNISRDTCCLFQDCQLIPTKIDCGKILIDSNFQPF